MAMTSFVNGSTGVLMIYLYSATLVITVYEYFEHRNSKNVQKPFITSAPFVKEKV